jgi:hypothetical protein
MPSPAAREKGNEVQPHVRELALRKKLDGQKSTRIQSRKTEHSKTTPGRGLRSEVRIGARLGGSWVTPKHQSQPRAITKEARVRVGYAMS